MSACKEVTASRSDMCLLQGGLAESGALSSPEPLLPEKECKSLLHHTTVESSHSVVDLLLRYFLQFRLPCLSDRQKEHTCT